jgi:hypothetical protein
MIKLILKVLEFLECLLTSITDKAEVAAERIARAIPIMPFHDA